MDSWEMLNVSCCASVLVPGNSIHHLVTDFGTTSQVNTQDDDHHESPVPSSGPLRIPHSPPPSFHSRQSSFERRRQNQVDPTLADAFDADGDDSDDDEPDDRQRLVRENSFPVSRSSTFNSGTHSPVESNTRPTIPDTSPSQWSTTAATSAASQQPNSRVYGGGIQSDGVFSNMMARPERGEKVVEEMPPVRR